MMEQPKAKLHPRPLQAHGDYRGGQVWRVTASTVTIRLATGPNYAWQDWDVDAAAIGHVVIPGDAILCRLNAAGDAIVEYWPGAHLDPPGVKQAEESQLDDSVRPWRPARIPEHLYSKGEN